METGKIYVVGAGPGGEEYILPMALAAVRSAEVLIGGKRLLETFAPGSGQEKIALEKVVIGNNLDEVIARIRESYRSRLVVVLVTGDPGFYGFLGRLKQHFSEEIEVIPGVSSFQVAAARLGLVWHHAVLASVHGRSGLKLPEIAAEVAKGRLVFLLTGGDYTPARVGEYMAGRGLGGVFVHLCEDLSYLSEKITLHDFNSLILTEASKSSLLVINATGAGKSADIEGINAEDAKGDRYE